MMARLAVEHLPLVLDQLEKYRKDGKTLNLDGKSLELSDIARLTTSRFEKLEISAETRRILTENSAYLRQKITSGHVVYGANTGYGGSADVRSTDVVESQRALIRHLNVGFGEKMDAGVVRAAMAVRANSLSRGYSGVRPEVVDLLCAMVNADIVPVVPLRGTVSASGDLLPLSYVAACMSGREDARVLHRGQATTVSHAFKEENLSFIEFQAKEALAVINAASCAASLAGRVLFDTGIALLLTQIVTAMSVECMRGRTESFHPTVHDCLYHSGNQEVAANLRSLLDESKLARHGLELNRPDEEGLLKQDRYGLRTAPQWLGPTVEVLRESTRRVRVELNSSNDNPLVDHRTDEIIHCGNFQGISITVAMDQIRQSIQMCGKLVFAQLSEILNHHMSAGLPPNLTGCDVSTDFGFKGVDTAMASYTSELDYLAGPMTNHVLSAEMNNQSVNSMALVSARQTDKALELLQMMLASALCAQCQAIDLRWLQQQVEVILDDLDRLLHRTADWKRFSRHVTWYDVAFQPEAALNAMIEKGELRNVSKATDVSREFVAKIRTLTSMLKDSKCTDEVAKLLGKGTRQIYLYVRRSLGVDFNRGVKPMDSDLENLFHAIKHRDVSEVITSCFSS